MTDEYTIDEVVLPLRVVQQTLPPLNPAGDCGACVLAGLLGMTVPEVYARYAGEVRPFDAISMLGAMRTSVYDEKADRVIASTPVWVFEQYEFNADWGILASSQVLAWHDYLRMALEAGFYAVTLVNFDHAGAGSHVNHWVMLCGARYKTPVHTGAHKQEVLVSCSSSKTPEEQWVDATEFLSKWGGFKLLLLRPKKREESDARASSRTPDGAQLVADSAA